MVRQATRKKLVQLTKTVEKAFPSIVNRGGKMRTAREGQRLSWGYNVAKDKAVFVLRSVNETGSAADWAREYIAKYAEKLRESHSIDLRLETVGPARAPVPNLSTTDYPPCREALEAVLRPGTSIGNEFGGAGSIGLVVVVEPEKEEPFLALTTAAHVLSLTNEMRNNREVASPAQSDRDEPKASDVIGEYYDGTLLVRQSEGTPGTSQANKADVAIVEISEDVLIKKSKEIDKLNLVPHPDDPENRNKAVAITEIVPKENISDYVDDTVYKVGRTTGYTYGRLELATAGNITPKMHNGLFYKYENLGVIEFPKDKDFSQPGDSGGLVYTREGKALGFIVAVEDKTSLFCPASTLNIYNTRLFNPKLDDF